VLFQTDEFRSSPINIEDLGSVYFRFRRPRSDNGETILVRTDIQIDGPTIFIYFSAAGEDWPFEIENESDYIVELWQKV
jgi:vacuolar protein sorting-associated protein 13A/C